MTYLVGFLVMPWSMMWSGYVLTIMWRWFVVPVFGVPALNIPQALGLTLIVRYLTSYASDCVQKERSEFEQLFRSLALGALIPLFALFIGWIFTWWL